MKAGKLTYDNGQSTTAINGFDPVAYFTEEKPTRGSGHHVAVFDGATYLFASEANKKLFEANPAKYAPAFGGYCAFGASVEKKFVADPQVWKIVDGKLYLALDAEIQSQWNKDVSGNIRKADTNWPRIKNVPAADL